MGFNTAAIILNDMVHQIRDCPDFGKRLYQDVISADQPQRYGNAPGIEVLPSCHADTAQVVVIGANSIRTLGFGHWRDDDEALLRWLADQKGYRLVRKAKR